MSEIHSAYLREVYEKLCFPEEVVSLLDALEERIAGDPVQAAVCQVIAQVMTVGDAKVFDTLPELLASPAAALDVPVGTLNLLLLLRASETARAAYRQAGYSEEVFWSGMLDFYTKLLECRNDKQGYWGIVTYGWFHNFFRLTIFRLGRLQYIPLTLSAPYTLPSGQVLPVGTPTVACHIPSGQPPMTAEACLDSYEQAYRFFQDRRTPEGYLIITCSSWLLNPAHERMLPPGSHIRQFMDDFDPVGQAEMVNFPDGWRVFGRDWGKPYEDLPERTTLQRGYKKELLTVGHVYRGMGVLVFDGVRIVNRRSLRTGV